jgi:hypothetical protein
MMLRASAGNQIRREERKKKEIFFRKIYLTLILLSGVA